MITSDQEQQVKLQFLDEATDYLDAIESGLLGLGQGAVSVKNLDSLLRAAHSIKGGAAMMGYTTLASLGHHLEDYFKIIQYGKSTPPDSEIEQLMLATIDKFRQIVALNRQGQDADNIWLEAQVHPIFQQLRERLGEFNPEDEANMLASESGEDILTFLFESEVERTLTQLEETIAASGDNSSNLCDELVTSAEDLGGFAEMVELPALGSLCKSVLVHIKAQPHQLRSIATLAIAAWRRTQAMVLIGQLGNLPQEIELHGSGIVSFTETQTITDWEQLDNNLVVTQEDSSIHESETISDWENIGSIDTTVDFGEEDVLRSGFMMDFGNFNEANNFQALVDDSNLDAFATIGQDLDALATFASELDFTPISSTITYNTESTQEQEDNPNLDLASSQTIHDFDHPNLVDDLSFDTDTPDMLSALSGFLGDFNEFTAAQEIPAATAEAIAPAIIKITNKPKLDRLEQEAADLFSALDAAPEVDDTSHHNKHSKHNKPNNPNNHQKHNDATNVAATVPSVDRTIRVATKQLEEIGDLFGELTIDRNGLNLNLLVLRQLVQKLQIKVKQLEQSNFKLRASADTTHSERPEQPENLWIQTFNTVSSEYTKELDLLEFDRYDEHDILSQEVMDAIVQIEELATDLDFQLNDTEKTNRDLNRTAKQLQTGLTQVRMRPISELFNRFPRAIRDLSIEHSKPIDLQFKGGTTLIERSILEALNDPLMHLVRNAFDHGIESSDIRRANSKSDIGTIQISATYRGSQTIITIKDDGGGIDLDKIRAKVKKMGMNDAEIANFKDSELIDLIFEPGFSTANKVTDLSGRGVGMDVVRTNIQELRGDIFVDTKLGLGSTFTITVPFTLSVVRVLLVEVNGMWLAIPSNIVEEIILLDRDRIINTAGQKLLQWEDFTVRLIQPTKYLRMPDGVAPVATTTLPTIDRSTVLMIDQGQDVVAFEIDKFWGEQEVTVRQPQGNVKMPPGFTGCTILGDGRIVPLVDATALIRWIDGDFTTASIKNTIATSPSQNITLPENNLDVPTQAPFTPIQKNRVLVIDDSINVRRFVAITLEKAGYLVEQAKDGQEAIEKLQTGLSIQAAVCDVEMPRMDGYGFLATIKGLPTLKDIPILMLTSRSGDKHRKIAMNLGASGYFSKPFKEQELLASLTKLLTK